MLKQIISSPEVFDLKREYSQVIKVQPKTLVFVSGQVALDRDGNTVGIGDIKAQARQVFENLKAQLKAAGADLEDVVKTTTFLTRPEDIEPLREVRLQYFKGDYPTSTLVVINQLVSKDWLIEVEAIAALG